MSAPGQDNGHGHSHGHSHSHSGKIVAAALVANPKSDRANPKSYRPPEGGRSRC